MDIRHQRRSLLNVVIIKRRYTQRLKFSLYRNTALHLPTWFVSGEFNNTNHAPPSLLGKRVNMFSHKPTLGLTSSL